MIKIFIANADNNGETYLDDLRIFNIDAVDPINIKGSISRDDVKLPSGHELMASRL